MSKEQEFITMVQTAVITKYACEAGSGSSRTGPPMWSIQHMDDAFAAAPNIPTDTTARRAAEAFIRWVFSWDLEAGDDAILKIMLKETETE
jgi:hypothetical protein